MFLVKRDNFNKYYIIKGLITAILFSAFIYLSYFDIKISYLDSILGLLGIYFLLTIPKKSLFIAGFFIGVFWCYWMSVSLQYYDLKYLTPIVLIIIGLVYAVIFYFFALWDKVTFRMLAFFGFSFLAPFGFNWIKPELIFINSNFETSKVAFALILIAIYLIIKLKRGKILALIPLLLAFNFPKGEYIDNPKAKIYMAQMDIKQDLKWKKTYQKTLINKNFEEISNAILNNNTLVVLPETSFATVLNVKPQLLNQLKQISYQIDIVTGALYYEDEQIYNATYFFSKGKLQIAKKVVLVPFGEKIPLPKFFVDLINNTFYNGAKDYAQASSTTDFTIQTQKFRNAICYEATTDKIFENLQDTGYMIAMSNNAWFTPSIEPTLQSLLLKYYSQRYNVTIFHVANGSKNKIFRP